MSFIFNEVVIFWGFSLDILNNEVTKLSTNYYYILFSRSRNVQINIYSLKQNKL